MIWREIISKAEAFLSAKHVPDAIVASELLASRLLGCQRGFLCSSLEKEVSEKHVEAMRRALRRLSSGEPLQYVLGEWDFRSLTLKCDSRALIPRPETEELVTRLLRHLKQLPKSEERRVIVDVGTGTGAIALSVAKEFHDALTIIATDVSEDALALAKENAKLTGLENRVSFLAMDGLDDFDEANIFDVIVSNPPYIESAECEKLDPRVKNFEPGIALDGGISGLDFYERYLSDAMNLLKSGGAVFFEIGENQGKAIETMMNDYGFKDVRIEKDYSGHDRYAMAVLP